MKSNFLKNLLAGYLLLSLLLVQSFALMHSVVHMFHVEHQASKAEISSSNSLVSQLTDQNYCDFWQLVSAKAFDLPTNFAALSTEFIQPGLVIVEFRTNSNQICRPFDSQAPPVIS